jgi:uncharacterized protein (TIGR01777 family)
VIAGGSGFVGTMLARQLSPKYEVIILSRNAARPAHDVRIVEWNGRDLGNWASELENAFALINLTGRNVNCRYNPANKREILESRTYSTKVLGSAISQLNNPPKIWLQMSSATIYRHSEDKPMDETFGEMGDDFSMNVCKEWEKTFNELRLDHIRKIIMRTSIVIGPGGGALPPLRKLVKSGLGGKQGDGKQMVSWIHEKDLAGIVEWMLRGTASGIYNVTAPQPLQNKAFMSHLRKAYRRSFGLPSPRWLLNFGATLIGTETELILKSRWVIPKKLLQEGYRFRFPSLESALKDIVE